MSSSAGRGLKGNGLEDNGADGDQGNRGPEGGERIATGESKAPPCPAR
jgi:hypothetical protein